MIVDKDHGTTPKGKKQEKEVKTMTKKYYNLKTIEKIMVNQPYMYKLYSCGEYLISKLIHKKEHILDMNLMYLENGVGTYWAETYYNEYEIIINFNNMTGTAKLY